MGFLRNIKNLKQIVNGVVFQRKLKILKKTGEKGERPFGRFEQKPRW